MNYLIIGGSGFIGQELCRKISNSFYILDKKKPILFKHRYYKCDVNNISSLEKNFQKKSIIINLAAEHKDDTYPVSKFYKTNYEAAKKICKIAELKKITKIIFFSSVAVYKKSEEPINETSATGFVNDYGYSKLLAEKVYINWQKKKPKTNQLIIIRPTVVYGHRNFNNIIRLIKIIKNRLIIFPGNGKNIKSIAYVENLVNFTLHVLKNTKKKLKIYNYADKELLSMNNFIRCCLMHYKYKIFIFLNLNIYFVKIVIFFLKKISFLNKKINILIQRIEKVSTNSIITSKENIKLKKIIPTEIALKKIINE